MTEKPLLYSFRRCPYAMRARMAILSAGMTVTLREVLLRDKPKPMLDASPKGSVPVLVLPHGSVIDESLDIMEWALGENDPMELYGHRDDEMISQNDGAFKQALDHYKYPSRYDLDDIEEPRRDGMAFLQKIESKLNSQRYMAGAKPGFTDFATFPFIRQFSMVDCKWFADQALPQLKPWLASLIESDMFAAAMIKHPPWQDGDDETQFP